MQSMKRSYKSTRMIFIFAILGPNHRVELGDGAAQLHKFRPRSHSSCRARPLSRAFLRPLISNSSRVRRKGLGTRLALAASASVETSNQRYPLVSLRLFLDFYSWNFEKTSVQKLWREKANMQMTHRQPLSRSFGTNETQQLREGQLVGSEASYWCNRRETSEIQA